MVGLKPRNVFVAKQNVIGGLLIFTILISVSLALGLYGYYTEKAPRTTTKTTPTTSPTETPTANLTTSVTTPVNTTTTPTNTTSEAPYVPK
ncbi:MAG: hypothetical protein ACP5KB_00135 [Thermoprotei archaeon]